jgi:hypothetical protein
MEALSHKTRINELISSLGISKNKFAKAIGTSSAMISKVTTQDINYGVDLAGKIISTFPSVNPVWLLTGVGEMMLSDSPLDSPSNSPLPSKQGVEKRPQVFISSSHSDMDTVREALLAARIDYRGRPTYYYQPTDKIYNYYTDLTPEEVEQRIEWQLDDLLDTLVDYNFLVEMINERRRNSASNEPEFELVTFKKVLENIEEDGLGENIAPNTSQRIQRIIYLLEVEAQLEHWRGAISQQIKRLASHGFGGINGYTPTYGKSYAYGKYPSAKQLAERYQEQLQAPSEQQPAEDAQEAA